MSEQSASILITNHNYARFLRAAIDSALGQDRPGGSEAADVVVVDDGSTDESGSVIASYGRRVRAIFKDNGGQASAINAGFAATRGEVVILLDADDVLLPSAAAGAVAALRDSEALKVHWPMRIIDETGADTGRLMPASTLPAGWLRDEVAARGPYMCEAPPTSGNAWRRSFLQRVLPVPERDFRLCADAYLLTAAAVHGAVARVDEPQSCYRMHRANHYWHKPFDETIRRAVEVYEKQCRCAESMLQRLEIPHDSSGWRMHSWWHRLQQAARDITQVVPDGEAFILADDDQWGTPDLLNGRRRIRFPQIDGPYCGPPASDEAALHALAHLKQQGIRFMIFGWPCFWYLEQYRGMAEQLYEHARCALRNERVLVFDLSEKP